MLAALPPYQTCGRGSAVFGQSMTAPHLLEAQNSDFLPLGYWR